MSRKLGTLILSLVLIGCSILTIPYNTLGNQNDGFVLNEVYLSPENSIPRWIEIYNPTDAQITVTDVKLYQYNMYTFFFVASNLTIMPGEYILITNDDTYLSTSVPSGTRIIQTIYIPYFTAISKPLEGSYIGLYGNCSGEVSGDDMGGTPDAYYWNQSWARYKGGYDTDNFTEDFYNEPIPTPGYENTKSKELGNLDDGLLFIIAGLTVGIIVVCAVAGYAWRKRR